MASLPLEGIRVIDLSEVWAGPFAASLLGDMGAQVIQVESYPRAPQNRPTAVPANPLGFAGGGSLVDHPWDRSAARNMANRNKYGITLNLRTPRGKALFKSLIAVSDVLIEGYSAGTVQRLELDYPVLRQVNPGLVMISMPGWGSYGPYAGYVTLGSGIDATNGHHYLRGYPDADPSETVACVHSDAVGAVTASFAAMTGLMYRRRTGKGQWVDLSQAEALLPHLAYPLLDYTMNGRVAQPLGNHDRWMAPHNCYRCKGEENLVAICVENDEQWHTLCRVAGHPEWDTDPRFADMGNRYQFQSELDGLIDAWTQHEEQRDLAQRLQDAGVPAGPVMRDVDLFQDPHLEARHFFQQVTHTTIGTHRYPGMLWQYTNTPMRVRLAPNALGEHNSLVLQNILGVSQEEYQRLEEDGLFGTTYAAMAQLDLRDQSPEVVRLTP